LRKAQMRDGASQPWPVFQGHPLSRPTRRKHCWASSAVAHNLRRSGS